jgi:predicted ArsR family transcriptional regulator
MDAWLYSVKPRLTELERMGLVRDSGERAKNDRGRQEIVWQITGRGEQWLKSLSS